MKSINLVYPEKSITKFAISNFPDGQVGARLESIKYGEPYQIASRFSSYKDLFAILAVNQVLRDADVKWVELFCPYILAARGDQKFQPLESFDLKLVAQVLNLAKFDKVICVDPHSTVLPALIDNCKPVSQYDAFLSWIPQPNHFWENKTIISPDAGSFKKLFAVQQKLNVPMITASKVHNGNELETKFDQDVTGLNCVIVDDICDGGRTFEQLGKRLKELGAKSVTLMVTHGVFSKGLTLEYIDKIYTTNSYRDFDVSGISDKFHVTNIF